MNFPNFMFGGVPLNAPYGIGSTFSCVYRCFSVAYLQKPGLESGGKIILPASALEQLARLKIDYPMLFEVTNSSMKDKRTHCGVLEFTADEGTAGLPYWMMQLLLIEEGGFVTIKSAKLPKGSYVKVQPQSSTFLDIANPKAVLENRLRNFAALTQGDVIKIEYNKRNYFLSIIEVKPSNAISIIETDIQLDFAPPLDYVEPTKTDAVKDSKQEITKEETTKEKKVIAEEDEEAANSFKPFTGSGYSLKSGPASTSSTSGSKTPSTSTASSSASKKQKVEEESDTDTESDEDDNPKFKAFAGKGYSLKK
eukprot:TRINITY_DN3192_c0_g1_i1.p1 TRINITY_DN3192_c0_g1~~TRINITY_DN3192_c0_g1_i1.p1  ORF type:complete len:309 (+),score=79.96 TRINITY_DN3192_c0_g1_i1:114-1040(+)